MPNYKPLFVFLFGCLIFSFGLGITTIALGLVAIFVTVGPAWFVFTPFVVAALLICAWRI